MGSGTKPRGQARPTLRSTASEGTTTMSGARNRGDKHRPRRRRNACRAEPLAGFADATPLPLR
eukprot:10409026-Alexandrium_andersonii.AAC.1